VIEVEPTQVILIRLALATVLADDHARNRFQHFACAHNRPRVELCRRDRTLTRGRRNPDKILGGILDICDVAKRGRPGHDDVGVERKRQQRVGGDRCIRRDADGPPYDGEVEQSECEFADPTAARSAPYLR
jgi:hypothetical protein